jgi:hypothetical protein
MCAEQINEDVTANILKHISMLKPILPNLAVVSIGEYSSQILRSASFKENDNIKIVFVEKTKKRPQTSKKQIFNYNTIDLDGKMDSHYWFSVQKYYSENKKLEEELEAKLFKKLNGAVMIASIGEGIPSALLPRMLMHFKEKDIGSVNFAILPSQVQPPDAYFNALWSMAKSTSEGFTSILIDRDNLEEYIGVDRKGSVLKGSRVLDYILDMVLENYFFVQEFNELSKSFNLKMFTILLATGASLKVYGSLKNILDTTLLRPLSHFDISTASILYVIVRLPSHLKNSLARSKIELIVDQWFKDKTNIKSAYLSEPLYVDDGTDRIDIILLVGGLELGKRINVIDKKISDLKKYAIEIEAIKEEEWNELIARLI